MSADNYIAIFLDSDGKFRGYDCCASWDDLEFQELARVVDPLFVAGTEREAILAAQEEWTEYGYRFINLAP